MSSRLRLLLMCLGLSVLVAANLGGCITGFPPPIDDGSGDNGGDDGGDNGGDGGDNGGDEPEKTLHEKIFTEIITDGFQATSDCMICHSGVARDVLASGHWTWEGETNRVAGLEGEVIGKMNLLNNFCIAVPSNEGRCAQCHPSFGWKSTTPPEFFENENNVDCLICHDTTGEYRKHPSANGGGGPPALVIDGTTTVVDAAQLQEVAYNVGTPSRHNCGQCHFYAGGGDNVKRGEMSTALSDPAPELDVHMGGLNFSCQTCHGVANHHIRGFETHHVGEGGESARCERCHGETNVHNSPGGFFNNVLNFHIDRVACETCHLPAFARALPTKVEWYWNEAGQNIDPIPTDEFGKATYDKMKGRFVWDMNVRPAYHWYDGNWERKVIGLNDTYTEAGTAADPVILAEPTANANTAGARVYPFKLMIGRQPADTVNKRIVTPHLFGKSDNLPHPYWVDYDWKLALIDGANYTGVPFDSESWTVENGFVNTAMYYRVAHEIPPASQALSCEACHGVAAFWQQLGIPDPLE